jgi:hypothetical protein
LLAAAPAVVLNLEAYAIAFFERADAGGLERARVNKDILAAVVRFNKAEPFRGVEEVGLWSTIEVSYAPTEPRSTPATEPTTWLNRAPYRVRTIQYP